MNTMPNNMIQVNVKFDPSLEELGKRFNNVNIKGVVQNAIEEFAFLTERESKLVTPVDTGRLRSSIITDIGNLQARIAPHVYYATYVHEGTSRMKARPFMSIGLSRAEMRLFTGKDPFSTAIEKEINSKLS